MVDSSPNTNIRAIAFDLGSTLIHFAADWELEVLPEANAALIGALEASGLDLDPGRFIRDFRARERAYHQKRENDYRELTTARVLRRTLAEHGYPSLSDAVIDQSLRALYRISQQYWLPEDDAYPTLKSLLEDGYRLGIISNAADDADVQALVDKVGVRPYLDFVISSAAFGYRKPAPGIFQAGLQHWDLPPTRAAMVGDTRDADILGGNRLGMFTVWITRRVENASIPPDEDEDLIPDAEIESLSGLREILS